MRVTNLTCDTISVFPPQILSEHLVISIQLALYQPDIPQNTGALCRLGACLNMCVHIIHPTGFVYSEKKFRRAAMDYADHVHMHEHDSFEAFDNWRKPAGKRLVLLSTKAENSVYEFSFTASDILLLGRESAGVPQKIADQCDARLRIPMAPNRRSMNVAVAAALAIGEAKRQTDGFRDLT